MTDHQEIPLTETHHCGCGESDAGLPELDVRTIPHAIRHGAVIGAFAQLQPGDSMVLIAPHNPLPLLSQLEQINGAFDTEYLAEGPQEWHIKLTKQS